MSAVETRCHARSMKLHGLALALVVPAMMLLSPNGHAAPAIGTAPPTPTARPTPKVLRFGKLSLKNAAAVPGEKRTFEARFTLGSGDTPLVGKSIAFRIEGKDGTNVPGGAIEAGSATTDATGTARLPFDLPELAQGAYRLTARFSADDDTAAATAESNLGMIKGITKIELSDLSWGNYKNETGAPFGTIFITLRRASDGKALAKKITMTVNGRTWEIGGSSPTMSIPVTAPPSTWNVKAQFMGDDANQAVEVQRTYTKP